MERVEVAERRRLRDLRRDPGRRQAVDLVQRDHDGRGAAEDALGDEAVAGADRSSAASTKRIPSTSANDWSTVRCMRSVSGSRGRWNPGRSDEDELVALTVHDARDRRLVVCGLSETIATLPPQSAFTSVDLPTFGRPATATKPLLTRE